MAVVLHKVLMIIVVVTCFEIQTKYAINPYYRKNIKERKARKCKITLYNRMVLLIKLLHDEVTLTKINRTQK